MIRNPIALFSMASVMLFAAISAADSQTSSPQFNSIPAIAFDTAGPVIRAHAESEKPFIATLRPRGAWLTHYTRR